MLLKRLEQWDHSFFCRLFSRSTSRQMFISSYWLSKTADGPLYLVLAVLLVCFEVLAATDFSLLLLAAFAIELPLYLTLKNSIKRARPADTLTAFICAHITPSDRFSLPSGHTAGAFIVATAVALYFPLFLPLALLWAVSIGMSRIMLGVHFPLDVIAGAVLGTSSCLVACSLVN
jgi:undecaprenyl-diphosphatase